MANIKLLPAAEADYEEAFSWYFARSKRAAARFETAFDQSLDLIAEDPQRYPLCDERHRFIILKKYPFRIIYRIVDTETLVVAVAHGRRRPNYWKHRGE